MNCRRLALCAATFLAGCATPPSPPSPEAPPPPRAEPPPATSAPSASASATAAPAGTPEPELPAGCVGADLDLDALIERRLPEAVKVDGGHWLRSGGVCAFRGDVDRLAARAGADRIAIAVEPDPVRVAPGGTAPVRLVFKNTSAEAVTLPFSGCLDAKTNLPAPFGGFEVENAAGDRVDRLEDPNVGCGVSIGCQPWTVAVRLAPGGTAKITGAFVARRRRVLRDCVSEVDAGVLPAGDYALAVRTTLTSDDGGRAVPRRTTARLRVGR